MSGASPPRESRILVVDDDPDITIYLASFLEDRGFCVRTSQSAASALAEMEPFRPDVVLVDVLMPGRSGLDLLVTLRGDPRWSNLTLVVMTGMDRILQEDCHSYLGSHREVHGPDAVLGKPIDTDTLLLVLERLTAEKRACL